MTRKQSFRTYTIEIDREARKNNCASLHKDIATLKYSGTECNQLGYKLGEARGGRQKKS